MTGALFYRKTLDMQHRAIETRYKGYRFRSRLEARWAVFFDNLGMNWEYEPEGYELPDSTKYLPDFWLPKFCSKSGIFVEVKPEPLSDAEMSKAKLLAEVTGRSCLLAVGTPSARVYELIHSDGSSAEVCFSWKYLPPGGCNHGDEYRLYYLPGYENKDGSIDDEYMDDGVLRAIHAARGARFEHGEKGAALCR
jgi:hypothetical protein